MPVPNSMGVSLTEEQIEDIQLQLKSIKDDLNVLIAVNLTKDERSSIQPVAEKRLPYVQTAFDDLIDANPSLQPGFMSLPDAKTNYGYMAQTGSLILALLQLLEIVTDHHLAAGSLAFDYMLEFYNIAKRAAKSNVPGADTVVDALSPLFEQENEAAPNPPA